jgi:DNA-binding transcriptional regulator YdaS (Cro superfamily)
MPTCPIGSDDVQMRRQRQNVNLVAAAIKIAGGVSKVAKELGVSRPTVYKWIAAGTMSEAPHHCVMALSKLSGIPPEQLGGE